MSRRKRRQRHGIHSLRGGLTLANVGLLAVGIVVAATVSIMGMRLYLLDQVDSELLKTRTSLAGSGLTLRGIDSLAALSVVRDQIAPAKSDPTPHSIYAFVDAKGNALAVLEVTPTEAQRELATAVHDPRTLVADLGPHGITLHGASYRVTATRLADGTYVLLASSTELLHEGIAKALKLDFAVGALLLALLCCLTMYSVRRRLLPLEDMVETSSAIAEGDLTRRVPSSQHPTQEVEQLRLALNSMLHQVETAYRTREGSAAQLRRFVADASHELRTPLAAIRGYLQLYEKGMLREPGERRRAWDRMHGEVDRMGRLV
ncbi:histidine kinase dimerization/phospho-acceptor domain-containing protein, partial [Streptomyces sp. NPDC004237]|uniref:histidine kinase dimerization/phospho-acceptor domain-containing protein n=1 Tax=Streptomyces sp. NPDC004237 TaxID=3154455 RepID=UPI0033A966D2